MALAVVAPLFGCTPPVRAQAALPEIATRCLLRDHDDGGALKNCTQAIEAGGMSTEVKALVYNARGEANCRRGEYDLALADQNAAIALVQNFPEAFIDRASCHLGKQDLKGALADYDEAIRLSPRTPGYYRSRATLLNWMGDHDRALADYDTALRVAPLFNMAAWEKALTLFGLGRFGEAADLMSAVIPTTPGDIRPVLWRHIARLRAHQPDADEFAAGIQTLDLTKWPGPLIDLFTGKASIDDIHRRLGPAEDLEDECEIAVFGGEYHLTRGEAEAAIQSFAEEISACPTGENQYLTAWAEQKRLVPAARTAGPW
jgi:tetratricopeptide (TPR) repeat protein